MKMGLSAVLSTLEDTTQNAPEAPDFEQHLQVFEMEKTSKGIITDHCE